MSESRSNSLQVPRRLKYILYVVILIASIGFVDATYLSVLHFQGNSPNCTLIDGCEIVTTSFYSEIFGVPVALGGAVGYVLMLLLALYYFDKIEQ